VGNWVLAFAGAQFIYITRFMSRLLFFTSIVLVLLSSCTSKTIDNTANATNDSIKKYLDLAGNDTIEYDKRIRYNDKAYSMIDMNRNDSVTISQLYTSNMNFYRLNQLPELKVTSNFFYKKAIVSKDDYWIGLSYKVLGLYYVDMSENEKALHYFFKAKKIMISINEYNELMNVLLNISITQYYAGDFLGSNKTAFEILKINRTNNNDFNYKVINSIGNNLSCLKQVEKAIEYYQKIENKKVEIRLKTSLNNNLSLSFIETGQYNRAYNKLDSIIKNKDLKNIIPNLYATSLSLFGYNKLKMNDLKDLPNLFFRAEEIYKTCKMLSGSNYNQIYLSMYYEKNKDTSNAIVCAKNALRISREFNNKSDVLASLNQLIKVDKLNASKNAQEYIRVSDSMQIAERNFRDKFARIAYETDEIIQEKDKAINQKWLISSISGVFILIISLLSIISRQRNKQKELQLLQEQQKANEEVYELMLAQKSKEESVRKNEKKRIALELHDGIMNKLASTRLNLDVLNFKKDAQTIEKCVPYIAEIYTIEQEIRNITHDLTKESIVIGNSFSALITDFINTQNSTYPKTLFQLEIEESISWTNISSSIKMNLFRIVQEATHNINKFAKAKKVVISFVLDEQNICLSITDNGIGFDPEIPSEGIGLKNMKQRVNNLKGKLIIQSIKNKSTSINIAIPLK
jgi:signal transduction histidine kinase